MKNLILASFIILAIFYGAMLDELSFATECQYIEGQIQLRNGWPPWIRIESSDKKHVFGIETNEEVTKSNFIPKDLLKKLHVNHSLTGVFCIKLTGGKIRVPYDGRVIEYAKIVNYTIK